MPAPSQIIERIAKAMWEETHSSERPWRNKVDSDDLRVDSYLRMARVAFEMLERIDASR